MGASLRTQGAVSPGVCPGGHVASSVDRESGVAALRPPRPPRPLPSSSVPLSPPDLEHFEKDEMEADGRLRSFLWSSMTLSRLSLTSSLELARKSPCRHWSSRKPGRPSQKRGGRL